MKTIGEESAERISKALSIDSFKPQEKMARIIDDVINKRVVAIKTQEIKEHLAKKETDETDPHEKREDGLETMDERRN